jgi:hypothetical protein
VTNPVTPSPDPWEVLRQAHNFIANAFVKQDADAALTTLRTQAERQEAVLRQAKLEHDWLVGICRSEGRKEVEGPSPFREMYAALSPNPEGEPT